LPPSQEPLGSAARVPSLLWRLSPEGRNHAVATHLGQVTVRLPRFRCIGCGAIEAGVGWPSHCRSTPEFDQLQAHFSALMPYRVAADVLKQVFPIDAGKDPETVRRHTLEIGATLRIDAVARPELAVAAVAVTPDSTFIRSCEDGERHLEVRIQSTVTFTGPTTSLQRSRKLRRDRAWSRGFTITSSARRRSSCAWLRRGTAVRACRSRRRISWPGSCARPSGNCTRWLRPGRAYHAPFRSHLRRCAGRRASVGAGSSDRHALDVGELGHDLVASPDRGNQRRDGALGCAVLQRRLDAMARI
jgi:hypothetical protein